MSSTLHSSDSFSQLPRNARAKIAWTLFLRAACYYKTNGLVAYLRLGKGISAKVNAL